MLGEQMDDGEDYRVKVTSKRRISEAMGKFTELLLKAFDEYVDGSEETKRLLEDCSQTFESFVKENVSINGESWDDAPDVDENDGDCKALDDMLDEHIIETTRKRSKYPKKILPFVVRSLKAAREVMELYEVTVKPQEMQKDPAHVAAMSTLTEAAQQGAQEASALRQDMESLLQKAEGLCQVLSIKPTAETLQVHREVFTPAHAGRNAGRLPLRAAVAELEQSQAYRLAPKRTASTGDEATEPKRPSA